MEAVAVHRFPGGAFNLGENTGFHRCATWLSLRLKTFFCSLLCLETPMVCRVFAKKPLDVVHRCMSKYLCKTVSAQCVNTLNYYARKIKLHTMLWNVCA